jgi:HD-GYP domain-containing protein (c-di-GMP phosphodiesterase class II)
MNFFSADAGTVYIYEEHELLGKVLRFGYIKNKTLNIDKFDYYYSNKVIPINSSSIAGYVAETGKLLSIPDVYELKGTPYGFNKSFDISSGYKSGSMLVVPLFGYVSDFEGVIQLINKKINGMTVPFSNEDELCMQMIARQIGGALDKALTAMNHMMNMVEMARAYDPHETGAHVQRVTNIGLEIAKKMNVDLYTDPKLREIFQRGMILHDIGKIGIPSDILLKKGKLTDEEREVMKSHTTGALKFFKKVDPPFDIAAQIALTHHERWDGKGYPEGKAGEDIPLAGRIAAAADVCEALSSKRSYKEPWPFEKVCELIKNEKAKQFDPDVVDAFLAVRENIYMIIMRDQFQSP